MTKFENILKFLSIFMSGDLKLEYESPDYIMEKFERYFGMDIEILQSNCITSLYEKHNKIWGHNDYRINSIFNFFYSVYRWSMNSDIEVVWNGLFNLAINNILCEPEMIIKLFNENIGNFSDIYDVDRSCGGKNSDGLHRIIHDDIYCVYFESVEEENENLFLKLERKEKLNKILKNDEGF